MHKELFDISKAQRIGAVVMSPNRYQQLITSLLTSVIQIDTIFFIIRYKDKTFGGIFFISLLKSVIWVQESVICILHKLAGGKINGNDCWK